MRYIIFITILSFCSLTAPTLAENFPADDVTSFANLVSKLTTKKFEEKAALINEIEKSGHTRALLVLQHLLDGRVYYKKSNKQIVFANIDKKEAQIISAIDGGNLGTITKKELKKVGINNKLRRTLNASIAHLSLANNDPTVRKSAAVHMFKNITPATASLLKERIRHENDEDVANALRTAISLSDLNSGTHAEKIAAIESLSDSLYPDVRVALGDLEKKLASESNSVEKNQLLTSIHTTQNNINSYLGIYKQIENIFFGVSLGSVLLLAAVGLAITFGVMGVINMAHGEMLMLGAYTTYIVQQLMPNSIAYSLLVSIPAAFLFTALVGIGIERGIIRFLYGRPLETLLATFGISLILQQAVRTIISPQNRAVSTPEWMSGSLEINPALSLTYNRLYIIIFALLVLAGLMLLLRKTNFGLQIRAVTQNRSMAKAMGIRTDWIDAFTFGLGSGIAGMAGVALSQLTNVGPNLGQAYIIDSFMVVVFGGVGNLWGTLFGAMTLGIANKYLEPFTGAVIAKILVLVFIILFIQKKPRGMFALKGRSAES